MGGKRCTAQKYDIEIAKVKKNSNQGRKNLIRSSTILKEEDLVFKFLDEWSVYMLLMITWRIL